MDEVTLTSGSSDPIKVEVTNQETLEEYLVKIVIGACAALLIKKGGEMLLDELNERRKARKARRKAKKEAEQQNKK